MANPVDRAAAQIMLQGLRRPWQLYAAHGAVFIANYGGFLAFFFRDLLKLLPVSWHAEANPRGEEGKERERQSKRSLASLLFAKFLVWQHLAEAIGCRQGPIHGHFGLPSNWKYRLSLGTVKYPLFPFLGKKRNPLDFMVHLLFFAAGIAFLKAKEYKLKYIRAFCACDVWIFFSDMTQFLASTGNGYFSMLLSACFPKNNGQLAGMQAALIMQWFFSGIGKVGPWFGYVNGPFMLQSNVFAGQRWLFNLLVKSPTDLSPTTFGTIFAHVAASVEYLAPIALMCPKKMRLSLPFSTRNCAETAPKSSLSAESTAQGDEIAEGQRQHSVSKAIRGLGLTGIVGMHVYILAMPAPFDVYSWNACFGLSAMYLFSYASFGFDYSSVAEMNPSLAAFLIGEFALCWYGQFFPDRAGHLLPHRYWAGNWVQSMFYVKNTEAVWTKLGRLKMCSDSPRVWKSLESLSPGSGLASFAYNWLGNLNMKAALGLIEEAFRVVGVSSSDYTPIGLTQLCCGEFRDQLYALPLLPNIQEQIGFDSGECFMLRLGSFGLFQDTATWGIYDLKDGLLKSGLLTVSALSKVHSYPSQSIASSPTNV